MHEKSMAHLLWSGSLSRLYRARRRSRRTHGIMGAIGARTKGVPMIADACQEKLAELLGPSLTEVWNELCSAIESRYEMERAWGPGGKRWDLEYKYRRGGKTLCALYAAPRRMGFMVIFGRDERAKVEGIRDELSESVRRAYDVARTYRDGKWVMFEPTDDSEFDDYLRLLALKRRPNRAEPA